MPKLIDALDDASRSEPIWAAFQLCLATGGTAPAGLIEGASRKLGADIPALAVKSVEALDDEAGYSAQVLACVGPDSFPAGASRIRALAEDPEATSYQRYLAARALASADIAVTIDGGSLPALPPTVDCTDPTVASDWMAVHQLHRLAEEGFYQPDSLVDCAAQAGGQLNAQSALAAAVVADRKPAELQKLSTPVIDPLEQQLNSAGLVIPAPPGGLRWTLSYAAALADADVEIPQALTRAVQDQIDSAQDQSDAARDGLLAGLCAVDPQLTCPAQLVGAGHQWVERVDFGDLEVNVFTWMQVVQLAEILDITPQATPTALQARTFVENNLDDLKNTPGVVEELITVASSAEMSHLVDALRPVSDPARTFTSSIADGPLTAAASAYTAAQVIGIDTSGWLDDLDAKLERYAINDITGFPYSDAPQPGPADSRASLAAATLIAANRN